MVLKLIPRSLYGTAPFFYPISAGFGSVDSVHKVPHKGVDIALPSGTPLHALADGIVSRVNDEGIKSFGKSLRLKTTDGTEVIYGHLSEFKAHIGQHVHAGDVIALSGNTGYSTGDHLHLQMVSANGHLIDPTPISHLSWWDALTEPKGVLLRGAGKVVEKSKEKLLPSLSDFLGFKEKINEIAASLHAKALMTPDPKDDKIDFVQFLYDWADRAPITHYSPNWFKEMIIYVTAMFVEVTNNAVHWLLSGIYKVVSSVVIWTPEFLFGNSWFPETISKFSILSIGLVSVVAMFEGLKRICRLSYTPFSHTAKRLPIALLVSGFAPLIFSSGVKILNKATKIILDLGSSEIGSESLQSLSMLSLSFQPLNILIMLGFAILFAALCIPMFIFHGKRWFHLLSMGILTPFAMSAYLFESTEKYFHAWLNSIKNSCGQQLIYAAFVSLLGVLMFATPNPETVGGIFAKMLVMIGGIYTLAYPPSFIPDSGKSFVGMYRDLKNKTSEFGEKSKLLKEKSENGLVKSAGIAGKVFRWITKQGK